MGVSVSCYNWHIELIQSKEQVLSMKVHKLRHNMNFSWLLKKLLNKRQRQLSLDNCSVSVVGDNLSKGH